jgi:hypothetical protein
MILVTLFALFLQSSNASPAGRLEAVLAGSWAGTLEYRDYRSDRRVTLPTRLVVTPAGEGALSFAYTYDDGPGKVVTSIERITITASPSSFTMLRESKKPGDDWLFRNQYKLTR